VHYGPYREACCQQDEAPKIGFQANSVGCENNEHERDDDNRSGADRRIRFPGRQSAGTIKRQNTCRGKQDDERVKVCSRLAAVREKQQDGQNGDEELSEDRRIRTARLG